MLKSIFPKATSSFLNAESLLINQLRTTFIVQRRWPPNLHRINGKPKPLRGRHYVYDLVKDTSIEKQPDLNVILTSYVDGFGNAGDRITAKSNVAYHKLLLPGCAVYATPENLEKYKTNESKEKKIEYSSPYAHRTMEYLTMYVLSVVMNKDVPWVLQPWHIKASFRKSGMIVPEHAVLMPEKQISGPDLSLEAKMFYVTVKINKTEMVKVRCRLHHWSTDITNRLPFVPDFWKIDQTPIFPEDKPILDEIMENSMKLRKKQA